MTADINPPNRERPGESQRGAAPTGPQGEPRSPHDYAGPWGVIHGQKGPEQSSRSASASPGRAGREEVIHCLEAIEDSVARIRAALGRPAL
jgi:hypothetical protein